MRTSRWLSFVLAGVLAAGVVTVSISARQQSGNSSMGDKSMNASMKHDPMSMKTMTKAEKIANAVTAAPSSVTAKATILDWPAKEGAMPEVLRPGSNGWTCFPDLPDTAGNDPACIDDVWMKWFDAYTTHKTPEIAHVGIGYMLAPGGYFGSNTDPYAMKETTDNHWGHHNPHVMILVPDLKSLSGVSTDPNNGGPYVMWAGTPYAHIMTPTSSSMR